MPRLGHHEESSKANNQPVTIPYYVLYSLLRVEVEDWFADRGIDCYSDIVDKVYHQCRTER